MSNTLMLTQIIGIYVLVASLSGLFYPERAKEALKEVTKSYIIPYFDGAIALIVGLLIILTHNVWNTLAETLVSLIGWLAILEGIAMLLLPQQSLIAFARRFESSKVVRIWSIIGVIIGAYLTYVGFFA
ncbi:MAG: hypothetical protein MRY49_01440 [Candidatus Pacebacteria bacterium]|nr:hypothetical protein [Candidatus Paceibacterota bacterium]